MTGGGVASTSWRRILHGALLILTGFACGGILILFVCDWNHVEFADTPPHHSRGVTPLELAYEISNHHDF